MLITSLLVVTSIILIYTTMYFIAKAQNITFNILKLDIFKHFTIILAGIIAALLHTKIEGSLILIINILMYVLLIKYILGLSTEKAFFSTFVIYVAIAFADVLGVVIYTFLDIDLISMTVELRSINGNLLIILLLFIGTFIKPLMLLIEGLIEKATSKIGTVIIVTISLISIIYVMVYYNIETVDFEDIIIKFMTLMALVFILIKFYIEKQTKNNLIKEYEKMNDYVKIYEDVIEKDRIRRHENKNQLITIKGMISPKDKRTNEYIDSLISDNSDKSYKWLSELKNIPIGGLKGLLFYKVNKMCENNIEVSLTISRSLENSKLQNIDTKTYKQLCQIIGVYIDNAIEACLETESKSIGIEIYKDEDIFEFIISNTYKGNIQVDNIDAAGYTTKGNGHGYGLSLVRDIINSNAQFFQNRELVNEYYIQHLFLDLTDQE